MCEKHNMYAKDPLYDDWLSPILYKPLSFHPDKNGIQIIQNQENELLNSWRLELMWFSEPSVKEYF